MQALVVEKLGNAALPLGSPDCPFRIDESHPPPRITRPTEVRVRLSAASVNFATVLTVMGKYQVRPQLPFVPGGDFSGVIVEVGGSVTRVKPGDRVCGVADLGTYAQELVVDETNVYLVPPGCDLAAAAGLPVAFGTSHLGLTHRAQLKAGQVLLVLGAAGGVGLAAVQVGKVYGATVIAAARGKDKIQVLRSLGADLVIDTDVNPSIFKPVQQFLKSKKLSGIDVLCDPVGGALFKEGLKLCKWGSQILVIGFASGEIPSIPANIALVKNLTVHGLYWGSYKTHKPEVLDKSLMELLDLLASGALKINVSHRFKLPEAHLAFSAVTSRKVIGKVVIEFDDVAKSRL